MRSTPIPTTRYSAPFRRTSSRPTIRALPSTPTSRSPTARSSSTRTASAPSPTNNLQQILAAQEIDHLALAGISIGGIVLSAALQAVDLDYQVTVLSDACADSDPAVHDTFINEILARRGGVATVDEWGHTLNATA